MVLSGRIIVVLARAVFEKGELEVFQVIIFAGCTTMLDISESRLHLAMLREKVDKYLSINLTSAHAWTRLTCHSACSN